MTVARLHSVDSGDLPVYPLGPEDDLRAHFFLSWHFREWLNSEMRLKGSAECRALYFDLICISQDQSPVGTLPDDLEQLAKLVMVDAPHFRRLCDMAFSPLHRWQRCLCGDQVRLYHPRVLKMVLSAVSRKEDNRARNEAACAAKRRQRLRETVAGLHVDLARNDAAILWMDDWLVAQNCGYRSARWIEGAVQAWSNHVFSLGRRGG